MQKKNVLVVVILFVLTAVLYYSMFSFLGAEDFSSEEDSSVIFFSVSVALALIVTLGSLLFTFIVSLFYRKTDEMKQNFYNKKFLIVFLIGWILTVLMSMTLGISA